MRDSILIVDAGGTSTKWCLTQHGASECKEIITGGINAVVTPSETIRAEVQNAEELLQAAHSIYFYGAGCASNVYKERIYRELTRFTAAAEIKIESDLLAAARALFGNEEGIACILGTGSNCGRYVQGSIESYVRPLGYILGDEGGGAHMGKEFLKRLLRGRIADTELIEDFNASIGMSYAELIDKVYNQPSPNHFLASLMLFLGRHVNVPDVQDIVDECLKQFFTNCVSRLSGSGVRKVGFIGSIAKILSSNLQALCDKHDLELVAIDASPMSGLVRYHVDSESVYAR